MLRFIKIGQYLYDHEILQVQSIKEGGNESGNNATFFDGHRRQIIAMQLVQH